MCEYVRVTVCRFPPCVYACIWFVYPRRVHKRRKEENIMSKKQKYEKMEKERQQFIVRAISLEWMHAEKRKQYTISFLCGKKDEKKHNSSKNNKMAEIKLIHRWQVYLLFRHLCLAGDFQNSILCIRTK